MSRAQDIQDLLDRREATPDLSQPSLRGLSWLLRHPERWPAGFEWHYANHCTCAIGLADKVWGIRGWPHQLYATTYDFTRTFGVGSGWTHHVFINQVNPTPERIADLIDLYLEQKA